MNKPSAMLRKGPRILIFILFILLISEITVRTFFALSYHLPFFRMDQMYLRYYPELKAVPDKPDAPDPDTKRILILGGSAVNVNFCNFAELLSDRQDSFPLPYPIQVDTLAQYAQNSLDSWYKYRLLKKIKYDYVIFYHGINDARTNNCPPEVFDLDYRQVAFYDELYVLFRHPEMRFTTLPWLVDAGIQKLRAAAGLKKQIPKEYNIMEYYFEKKISDRSWWEFGADIKTRDSFRRNLENILKLADEKGERVLVMTYAHYLPADYTLENFIEKKLDYDGHAWPVEIYGDPQSILKGIRTHNEISRELAAKYPKAILLDFANLLPSQGVFFQDICHLTPDGCREMGKETRKSIIEAN
jgi:hypothetical protein